MYKEERQAIEAVIEQYFNASYNADGQAMLGVFHSSAHIYSVNDKGELNGRTAADFAAMVGSGVSPASIGQAQENSIIDIHFTGPKTAAAIVKLRLRKNRYTDILNFMLIDGRWQVIAKVLSAETVE